MGATDAEAGAGVIGVTGMWTKGFEQNATDTPVSVVTVQHRGLNSRGSTMSGEPPRGAG